MFLLTFETRPCSLIFIKDTWKSIFRYNPLNLVAIESSVTFVIIFRGGQVWYFKTCSLISSLYSCLTQWEEGSREWDTVKDWMAQSFFIDGLYKDTPRSSFTFLHREMSGSLSFSSLMYRWWSKVFAQLGLEHCLYYATLLCAGITDDIYSYSWSFYSKQFRIGNNGIQVSWGLKQNGFGC